MKIRISPSVSKIEFDESEERSVRHLILVFSRKTKMFVPAMGRVVPGPTYYVIREDGTFDTGILRLVLSEWFTRVSRQPIDIVYTKRTRQNAIIETVLSVSQKTYDVASSAILRTAVGLRTYRPAFDGLDSSGVYQIGGSLKLQYRDYLVNACDAFVKRPRGIFACATNAGKTFIAAAVIERFPDARVLLTVPYQRSALAVQGYNTFLKVGLRDVGLVKGSNLVQNRIVWASVATLVQRMKDDPEYVVQWLRTFNILIKDECHEHTESERFLYSKMSAWARLGLDGTPFRDEAVHDSQTVGMFGPVIYKISNKFLVDRGISAKPHVVVMPFNHQGINHKSYRRFSKYIAACEPRNKYISQIAQVIDSFGFRVVVSTASVNPHTVNIRRLLTNSEVYSGILTTAEREAMLRRFAKGQTRYLVASKIFDVGVSEDSISGIVLAGLVGKGLVSITSLQKIGRGLRSKDGKTRLLLVDVQDVGIRYGQGQAAHRTRVWESDPAFSVHKCSNIDELTALLRSWNNG